MAEETASAGDEIVPGSGVIEVYVRDLEQFFNSMDPSPFNERSLDRDAEEFILSHARELPTDEPLALHIYLAAPVGLPGESLVLRDAIRRHFSRRSGMARRELRQLLRRGWKSLVIGLVFLAVTLIASEEVARHLQPEPLAEVLRESLVIAGWVAMWGPMEIFLYEWWPIRDERRLLDRLGQVMVRISYTGSVEATDVPEGGTGSVPAPLRTDPEGGGTTGVRPIGPAHYQAPGGGDADPRSSRLGRT